jgi:hypothetical protein
MNATVQPSQPVPTVPVVAAGPAGVVNMERWLEVNRPSCCPDARCSCECRCQRHSHYRRCSDCSRGHHHPPRAVVVPLTARSAIAFAEWPPDEPPAPVDHLGHLRRFMRDGPREVDR